MKIIHVLITLSIMVIGTPAQVHRVPPGYRDKSPSVTMPKFLNAINIESDFKELVDVSKIYDNLVSNGSYCVSLESIEKETSFLVKKIWRRNPMDQLSIL